ncbi:MAG TPA: hypothetical protein VFN26_24475 [Candidatus Acidoferrum sp.]|nr:hypothetical protein [Candidatus Acidoferrum sp.]
MKVTSLRIVSVITVAILLFGSGAAYAQAPFEPAQMSPRTIFYLIWRGAPSLDVRKANSLLALWDDPEFVPVRSAVAAGLFSSTEEKSAQQKLTQQEMEEFVPLLENSFTLGYLPEPLKRAASNSSAATEAKIPAWNGMFFVYDRTGKEALLTKAAVRMRTGEKELPALAQVTLAGVQVLKIQHKSGVTYWAESGKYAIASGEPSVMEEILGRLNKKAAAASLAQSATYQEAQPITGSGVLEFFVRIPSLSDLMLDSNATSFKVRPMVDAVKLEAVHSISGHITLEGAKTHVQAAVLGDADHGTLFDIWSEGQASPASLALVPAEAVSYTETQIHLMGIYSLVKRVARAAFPQGQQGNADILDTVAQARLGMPLPDALALMTGEFASMQTSPSMDGAKQVYFFGIRKKPEVLRLFHTIFSDQLTSERNEGDTTFLKISLGGNQSNAGVAQWRFFHVAVTPEMVIGASRQETIREVLAYRAKGGVSAGLSSVPQFQAGRAKYPENLSGLSYVDFQKIDWQAVKDRWLDESKKAAAARATSLAKEPDQAGNAVPDWLAQANLQVIGRHLHYSSSVSWKDSKGIHWDQWLE